MNYNQITRKNSSSLSVGINSLNTDKSDSNNQFASAPVSKIKAPKSLDTADSGKVLLKNPKKNDFNGMKSLAYYQCTQRIEKIANTIMSDIPGTPDWVKTMLHRYKRNIYEASK